MKNIKECHFFIEKNDKKIYCNEYLPHCDVNRQYCVILCKPIWGERIRTHRIFTNLARMLAQEGFSVITCDYFGDGNSGGETLELNFFSMVDDILCLYNFFSDKYQFDKFALIGLLIGSNIAIEAAKNISNMDKMILFEPLLKPIDWFKKALRANLSSQMIVHKKVVKNREALIQDLKNNISVNIDGFVIGKKLWESFENASPLKVDNRFNGNVSIYSMVKKGRKGKDYSEFASQFKNGQSKIIEQEFIWTDWKYYIPRPPIFFDTIQKNLGSNIL